MMKVLSDLFWISFSFIEKTHNSLFKIVRSVHFYLANNICFNVLIQIFVRIKFGAVCWQVKNSNFVLILFHPVFNSGCLVSRKIIYNQKRHAFPGLTEAFYKSNKLCRIDGASINHEKDFTPITDSGDHIDAK